MCFISEEIFQTENNYVLDTYKQKEKYLTVTNIFNSKNSFFVDAYNNEKNYLIYTNPNSDNTYSVIYFSSNGIQFQIMKKNF